MNKSWFPAESGLGEITDLVFGSCGMVFLINGDLYKWEVWKDGRLQKCGALHGEQEAKAKAVDWIATLAV